MIGKTSCLYSDERIYWLVESWRIEGCSVEFFTAKQAAELWGISPRRVALLCAQGRIPGAVKAGKTWLLQKKKKKPLDPRFTKSEVEK